MGTNGSKHKITEQDRAILDLKSQRDKLQQYQKRIQIVIDKEVELAKQSLAVGNKPRALLALKKKKYQEQLLSKTDAQLANLEELTSSIEFALVEKQVFEGLRKGNDVLKELHKEMSLEDVERLMDETADAIAYQNEIDQMITSSITDEDEQEVIDELERLQQEEIAAQLPAIPESKVPLPEQEGTKNPQTILDLPSVPNHTPASTGQKQRQKAEPMLAE